MRRLPVLATVAAGLLAAGLVVQAPAEAATVTQVTSVTVPTTTIDLETSPGAVLRAHLVDPVGIAPGDPNDGSEYNTNIAIIGQGGPVGGGYLQMGHLVSGTPQDGEWEFQPFTEARAYGKWEATQIHVLRLDGTGANIPLRPLGFTTVFSTLGRFGAGFDRQSPTSAQNTTLVYGGTLTLKGRLTWIDELSTSRGVPGKEVTVLQEDNDEPVIDGDERVLTTTTTKADGTFAVTVRPDRHAFRIYLKSTKGTLADGVRYRDAITWSGRVDVKFRIAVRNRPTSLKAGTIGYVEGSVVPVIGGQNAYLQRYKGGKWTIVSSAHVRSSGRFTLAAQPPTKGTFRYRVYKASDASHAYNVTPEFPIKGT